MKFTKVRLLLAVLSWFTTYSAFGQNYTVSIFAGGGSPILNIPGTQASLGFVYAVAADSAGNVFIAGANYPTILRVDHSTGILSSLAGTAASIFAVDSAGNVYFQDGFRIRKFSNGAITVVAGNGTSGFSGDNGPATSAQLSDPAGLVVDAAGNLYIADGSRVRKVSNGVITTVAGGGTGGFSDDNVPATSVPLASPSGLAVDAAGNLYIADWGIGRVREVSNGVIKTVAGNGNYGSGGDNGPATSAQLELVGPTVGVAVDSAGNLYIGGGSRVRKVSNGVITTAAGGGAPGPLVGDNGPAIGAPLLYIYGIAVDSAGNLYIADHDAERIRKVSNGVITTLAGGGYSLGDNGPAIGAQLSFPQGVAVDSGGNLYIADNNNARIRKVSNGVITTVAGTGIIGGFANGFSGDNGPATSAQLAFPAGVAVDSAGDIYIADNNNLRIRKVSNGIITTVAGNGTYGFSGDNGPATSAQLVYPQGVAVDSAGNFYIAEANRIRKVSNGVITTVAGTSGFPGGFSGDNGPATSAQLSNPAGLAVDSAGNLYIADTGNNRIRKVANGVITTVAGGGASLGDNGPATSAQLSSPNGVALDFAGNLYIADAANGRIRKVSNGMIGTVAGGGSSLSDSGPATDAALGVDGLALDSAGNVYFSDNTHILVLTQIACTYALDLGGQSFTAQGGMGSITITTQFGCSWSVANLPASVTLTSPASGTGTATVTFQVTANSGGDLSTSFTIAGQSFTVEQEAGSIAGLNFVGSMAHLAGEENWTTSFTLVNKSNSTATARLSLFGDLSDPAGNGPLALPLVFSQQASAAVARQALAAAGPLLATSFDRTLAANASLIVSTAGAQTPPVLVGSAQLSATGAVDGFAIFHQIVTTQEAVVPMETRNASSYLLPFDNTNGLVLGVAVENVSASNAVIPVIVRDENGVVISAPGASISLGGNGHTSFVLSDPALGFPVTADTRGTIEFDTPAGGRISVLGLRFTPPNSALTTIPALANVGTGGGSIAHLASGGDGWQTTFVLVNTGTSAAQFTLSFFNDQTGAPMSLPLSFPQPNGGADTVAPSVTQNLATGATRVIVSSGAANLLTGSAQLTTAGHVSGFVIFRHNNQEAVVPLESRNARGYIIAFDNTNGTATGIAVNAVSATQVNIPVTVRDSTGATIASDTITLNPNGHYAFTLVTDRYAGTNNMRGTIEFDAPAGAQIGALGIRIPGGAAHTYTTLPALAK
jgi:sugar lactone lactonase YvrE